MRGRELFACPGHRFRAVVTTLTTPPEEVRRTCNGRADTENRLKEPDVRIDEMLRDIERRLDTIQRRGDDGGRRRA
jgi:hypothetical protein